MKLTNHSLDTYVSQELSKLNKCSAPDLSNEFEHAEQWVNTFILGSMLKFDVNPEAKPYVFGILRRAQMAIAEYCEGRSVLLDYLNGSKQRVSVYFRALYHFELVVSLVYQAHDMAMKMTNRSLFETNDGSPVERLNRVYNTSKHIEASSIPRGYTHSVWLTNDGVSTSTASLTWQELADLVIEVGKVAEAISDPPVPNGETTNA